MKDLLINSVVIGCIAAFFITLGKKWGIVEYLQVHGSELISEMAHCDFCMSFWVCVVLSLFYALGTGDVMFIGIPFVGTMVSRFLL